jgi:hypothetical protein
MTSYATVIELKVRLGITDTANDADLTNILAAASAAIEADRRRQFAATASETRYYQAVTANLCPIDDLLTLSSLKTDNNEDYTFGYTWASTDYQLLPVNGPAKGEPYTAIRRKPNGSYAFPTEHAGVLVTGTFGYSATVPAAIKEAAILIAMRVWKRKDVLFGITGGADLGVAVAVVPILKDGEIRLLLDTIPIRITV